MPVIEFFDGYRALGFKPIPLHPFSKVPVFSEWTSGYDPERCREYIAAQPACNLGLLLGQIVDVEADTPEAGEALDALIGDYPHPRFTSSRSTHHLFVNPDPRLTMVKVNGIEFRGHRHQSVLPPSIHEDGTKYQWLRPFVWPVPVLPPVLADMLKQAMRNRPRKRRRDKTAVKPGHCKPWCSCCKNKVFIHRKRYTLEVEAFKEVGYPWMCHACREMDVRPACRVLRKKLKSLAQDSFQAWA